MAPLTGITLERTATGRPKYVRLDYKEYGAVLYKFLLSEGIDCSSLFTPNETTKIAISEIKQGKGKTFKKSADLFKDLGI
jgi:hypothetical protein